MSRSGLAFFRHLGVDVDPAPDTRRAMCRVCLDWSERRHHLAGQMGVRLLQHCYDAGWAKRRRGTRIVDFTPRGEREFRGLFA